MLRCRRMEDSFPESESVGLPGNMSKDSEEERRSRGAWVSPDVMWPSGAGPPSGGRLASAEDLPSVPDSTDVRRGEASGG